MDSSEKAALQSLLLPKDFQQLCQLSEMGNQFLQKQGDSAWEKIDCFILKWIADINFINLVNSLSYPKTYFRIPISKPEDKFCLTLFIFKSTISDGRAVLLHTYSYHLPNGDSYDEDMIINPPAVVDEKYICQTPLHSHRAICHSCIAWTEGHVTVVEQQFETVNEHQLRFLSEEIRPMYHCTLDKSMGEMVHRIQVIFK